MTTRKLPFLGPETIESHTGLCGFRPGAPGTLPMPPSCLAEATWHGLVLADDGQSIRLQLSTCDAHKGAMVLTAEYIHEFSTACALDGATMWWDSSNGTSGCFTEWDISTLSSAASVEATA